MAEALEVAGHNTLRVEVNDGSLLWTFWDAHDSTFIMEANECKNLLNFIKSCPSGEVSFTHDMMVLEVVKAYNPKKPLVCSIQDGHWSNVFLGGEHQKVLRELLEEVARTIV